MLYYLQANSDGERYKYLKLVKSALRKVGRITIRNILDLSRNIENTFKTESNYKIKLLKLENHKLKLTAIQQLIEQTEKLITEDELTFFKTATDEELKLITIQLRLDFTESRQNLIETRKQIIEYINQIKYQSKFIEKLRQIKYLKDQFEIKAKTNIVEIVGNSKAVTFEPKPTYPLKLSLDSLQDDDIRKSIEKIYTRIKPGLKPLLQIAEGISSEYLNQETEIEVSVNLDEIKNSFSASGNHLFDFVLNYKYQREVSFEERVTVYCQLISMFEEEFEVSEHFSRHNEIEYAMVYPK